MYSEHMPEATFYREEIVEGKPDAHYIIYGFVPAFPPPRWVPVKQYKQCYHCNDNLKSGSTHNCRLCGELFCSRCTAKYHLPDSYEQKDKMGPSRVCYGCRMSCIRLRQASENLPLDSISRMLTAPTWQDTKTYTGCNKCAIKRKAPHNCRLCGMLHCSDCTTKLALNFPPAFNKKGKKGPQRCCDSCRYRIKAGTKLDDGTHQQVTDFLKRQESLEIERRAAQHRRSVTTVFSSESHTFAENGSQPTTSTSRVQINDDQRCFTFDTQSISPSMDPRSPTSYQSYSHHQQQHQQQYQQQQQQQQQHQQQQQKQSREEPSSVTQEITRELSKLQITTTAVAPPLGGGSTPQSYTGEQSHNARVVPLHLNTPEMDVIPLAKLRQQQQQQQQDMMVQSPSACGPYTPNSATSVGTPTSRSAQRVHRAKRLGYQTSLANDGLTLARSESPLTMATGSHHGMCGIEFLHDLDDDEDETPPPPPMSPLDEPMPVNNTTTNITSPKHPSQLGARDMYQVPRKSKVTPYDQGYMHKMNVTGRNYGISSGNHDDNKEMEASEVETPALVKPSDLFRRGRQ